MSISNLGALVHLDSAEAQKRILEAITQVEGNRKQAAEILKTTHRSLYRHIEKLKLWEQIDALIKAHPDWMHFGGPPRASERIRDAVLIAKGNLTRAASSLDLSKDVLSRRITELDLWDDLNRRLSALGCSTLRTPRETGARARAR